MADKPFKLMPKQIDSIKRATKRINIWHGAVRSGKTIASIVRFIQFVCAYTGTAPLLVTGKTERTIDRNIMEPMYDLVGNALQYSISTGEGSLFGVKLLFAGANDVKSEGKIRGLTSGGGYGDEVTLWREDFFKMWMSRLSVEGAMAFLSTNPDSPYHYLKKDYLDNPELHRSLAQFHFKLSDNIELAPDYVESLKLENRGLWKKRFIEGLWVLAEGAIYDCYREEYEVVVAPFNINAKDVISVLSCDYGTSNACCFLKIYILMDYKTGGAKCIYVENCFYWDSVVDGAQKSDSKYADEFIKFAAGRRFNYYVVDPSALSFIVELESRGIPITTAQNDVVDGIRFVFSLIDSGIVFINKLNCKKLIEQLCGYVWDKTAQLLGEDKPLKVNDHAPDTLRYGIYTIFEKCKDFLLLMRSMAR